MTDYAEQRLFDESHGTLSDQTARKAASRTPERYSLLFYMWKDGETPRGEIEEVTNQDPEALDARLHELINAGLITRTGGCEEHETDTMYSATHVERQEIESDMQNIIGETRCDPSDRGCETNR